MNTPHGQKISRPAGRTLLLLVAAAATVCTGLVGLAPGAPSRTDLLQTVVLEATRQDMVEHRINELISRFEMLHRDLRSNGDLASETAQEVDQLAQRLRDIRTSHLVRARAMLRLAIREPNDSTEHLADARHEIRLVTRQLGSLLLRAGMSHAADVFADEVRGHLSDQEQLRSAAAAWEAGADPQWSPQQQQQRQVDLTGRTEQLMAQIGSLGGFVDDPLASVRIRRAHRQLVDANVVARMKSAAEALNAEHPAHAATAQTRVVGALRKAQRTLRPDATMLALVRARTALRDTLASQKNLRRASEGLSDEQFKTEGPILVNRQRRIGLAIPPVHESVDLGELGAEIPAQVSQAAEQMQAGNRPEAVSAQRRVESLIGRAIDDLDERIAKAQELDKAYRRLQIASSRLKLLQDLHDRQGQLLRESEMLNLEGKNIEHLALAQKGLAEEIAGIRRELPEGEDWSTVIGRPLEATGEKMTAAREGFDANSAEKAQPRAFDAMTALAEAVDAAEDQVAYLEQLWSLRQLSADMQILAEHISQVQAEQDDVRQAMEAVAIAGNKEKVSAELIARQHTLTRALDQVQEIIGNLGQASQVEQELRRAEEAMTGADEALAEGKVGNAVGYQVTASMALEQARTQAIQVARKADYLTNVVSAMEQMAADTMDLLQRQIVLRRTTEKTATDKLPPLAGEQDILHGEVEVFTTQLGYAEAYYRAAMEAMAKAGSDLQGKQKASAVANQKEAEENLRQAILQVQALLQAMLEMMEETEPGEPELFEGKPDYLTLLLLLAVEQKELRDEVSVAAPAALESFAEGQDRLMREADALVPIFEQYYIAYFPLQNAVKHMRQATAELRAGNKPEALEAQRQAERELRKAFSELVVLAYKIILEPEEEEEFDEEFEEEEEEEEEEELQLVIDSMMDWSEHLKSDPKGKEIAKNRAEWEGLLQRERGALHENFARELPLEYREMLKEYYRRLARD